jgi:hypothetical protein
VVAVVGEIMELLFKLAAQAVQAQSFSATPAQSNISLVAQ